MTDREMLEKYFNNPVTESPVESVWILVKRELARMDAEQKQPNQTTIDAIKEAESSDLKAYNTADDMIANICEKKPLVVKERPFKVGDEVWDFTTGDNGVVKEVLVDSSASYTVNVYFAECLGGYSGWYIHDGKEFHRSKRTLFHLDVAQSMGWVDMVVELEDEK